MDQRLEKLEQLQREIEDQLQAQRREQLAKIQQDMMDKMLESQRNMMTQLTHLLTGGIDKGKGPMTDPSEDNKEALYPLGHSIKNCTTFKQLVEMFINMGILKFYDSSNTENSLPNHAVNRINMMSETMERRIKTDIAKIKTPLRRVWKEMNKTGLIDSDLGKRCKETMNYCEFHHEKGHEIQKCKDFKS
ncbi:hypothetical protein Gotur_026368 [Gossypium turneri]